MAQAASIKRTMGPIEWVLLIVLATVWGGSFFFGEVALVEMRPFTVVFGRVGMAAAVLLVLVNVSGHRLPADGRTWGAFFVMGAINNLIPFSLIFWG